VIASAEQVATADFVAIDLVLLELGEFSLGVADAVFKGLALVGGQLFEIERLTGFDTDFGLKRASRSFSDILRRGERQA
jgi:hypothetical protein